MDKSALDLADIQGFIVRGYRMPMVRHFLLTVGELRHKRAGNLDGSSAATNPTPRKSPPPRTGTSGFAPQPGDNPEAAPRRKPDYCLNIGITWPGLVALEIRQRVPTLSFKSFGPFIEGAAQRAAFVGDSGASAPQNWVGGFGKGDNALW